ncbi:MULTISPECIES: asparagine synthase (glutamine-hydrolyzing) [Clostridium]|jgi:asparagine synthase (glutamine-hydrolyzing)|uniref:asparagine synthase (glutamine-hydrolyzing) n=3 Tax=Clostridium beijerinckii TaxID=1520 RepID=A0A1S8PBG7_CLOBE|nr:MULTISPECIES: asparagine synthase (glutamine-hydrolyzing) [Clostridium]ABR33218.1 asparagine synthase (glutamine-hydrolyzing) [Clostridium beijerinckii NCIMB 8052]AIU04138.1 asparagine synthase (glutamine-hydrolyzing) [Clostridium beijerinckii ATCC 35702]AQS03635.1 asparagine synthetase 3 [Clostridium beijerinckii]MBA2887490.1 asparagine synthase (glutamine-hydrolyzing) [Clostridium beijerinckii]MBA2902380.1 asparagine synthase (glutamine-hydrolyzing) [Clostridium beijerinckii]
MCGIAGLVNFKKNIVQDKDILNNMIKTLEKRGPDAKGYYISPNVLLGHRRLIVVDPEGGLQPMTKIFEGKKYTLVYNGELYNTEDLRKELKAKGFTFDSYSDTEVLLTSYICWGKDCVNKLIGIFAFGVFDEDKREVFLARDQMGVKPLFYTVHDNTLVFGSEIKTLLADPRVKREIDMEGLTEIFGLGPATIPGSGVFKNIKEIAPANCLLVSGDGNIKKWEYWTVEAKEFHETAEEAIVHARELLIDAVKRQLVGDVPVCTFLSGGLDSSIISAIAAEEFRKQGKKLTTYAINYEDNEKYFKASLFQPTSDEYWSEEMAKFINSDHRKVVLNHSDLAAALRDAVISRDLPGMADIDSSMLLFCKEIRKDFVVGLTGECADEIFGGYPWFTRDEMFYLDTFPWSRFVNDRKAIVNKKLKNMPLEELVRTQYEKSLSKVPHLDGESKRDYRMREVSYLNLKWFMVQLLTRKDRTSMYNGLEARVPFADIRLVDYAFNLPADVKLYKGREKGLLRAAFEGILPNDIIYRKKSPYPKTHNPVYTDIVCKMITEILDKKSSPIHEIIDEKVVREIILTKGESYKAPWYGQLMTGPQLLAFLIQVNIWLEEYNVNLLI